MKQLQKLQMHQALAEIQADEENQADQQFYGDMAFNEWLQNRGLAKSPTVPPEKAKKAQPAKGKAQPAKAKVAVKKEDDGPKLRTAPRHNVLKRANTYRPPVAPPVNAPSPILEESPLPQRRVQVCILMALFGLIYKYIF